MHVNVNLCETPVYIYMHTKEEFVGKILEIMRVYYNLRVAGTDRPMATLFTVDLTTRNS